MERPTRTGVTGLTDDELLLFDFMFDKSLAFRHMRRDDYAFHMNTSYSHDLDDTQLGDTLRALCERGLIRSRREPIWSTERREFEEGDRYTLTEQGGAMWQLERLPDWTAYVRTRHRDGENTTTGSIRITCVDESIARLCAGGMFAAGLVTPLARLRVRAAFGVQLLPWKRFDKLAVLHFRTRNSFADATSHVRWNVYEAARRWWEDITQLQSLIKQGR